MTMKETKSATKDPICGMTVDEATALIAERGGEKFYFCSEHCRQKFKSTPVAAKPEEKAGVLRASASATELAAPAKTGGRFSSHFTAQGKL